MINEWFKKIQYYFVFDFGIEDLNLPLNNNITIQLNFESCMF